MNEGYTANTRGHNVLVPPSAEAQASPTWRGTAQEIMKYLLEISNVLDELEGISTPPKETILPTTSIIDEFEHYLTDIVSAVHQLNKRIHELRQRI